MIERPPVGWRKPMPLSIKLQVVINQKGMAPDATLLDALGVGIHFDHRPPLHEREYDPLIDDTIPPANDVRFIVALPVHLHREISKADVKRIRKADRLMAAEIAFQKALQDKRPGQKRATKGTIRNHRPKTKL